MKLKEIPFITMDVFTDRRFGGNPLAIFPSVENLTSREMQQIASELNLSETIFILNRRESARPRVRIFTPSSELSFAGHPTVGAAIFLASRSNANEATTIEMETKGGLVTAEVFVSDACSQARITAPEAPYPGPAPSAEECAAFLSLQPSALAEEPRAYSAGVPYTIVPLVSRTMLSEAKPNLLVWEKSLKETWAPAVYAIFMDDYSAGHKVHARMFAPGIGIGEDPATGSAAIALTGWLCERQVVLDGDREWIIYQGQDMGRSSQMTARAEILTGVPQRAQVSGCAVHVMSATIKID